MSDTTEALAVAVENHLLDVAKSGARAPTRFELQRMFGGDVFRAMRFLTAAGRLRIEVYAKNWRVIEIQGHRTARPPFKGAPRPYRVIDQHGDSVCGKRVPQHPLPESKRAARAEERAPEPVREPLVSNVRRTVIG